MHEQTKVKYERRTWYDNLREGETAIWNRFIDREPDAFDEVIYNLHVGQGAAIPEGTEDAIARDFRMLTQYKIDVVGFKGNTTSIIEIKPYAGAGAIGQLLTYAELYKKDVDPAARPRLIVLTDRLRPDTERAAKELNIEIVVV